MPIKFNIQDIRRSILLRKILWKGRVLFKKLSPPLVVGGFQVSDSLLHFVEFRGNKVSQAALRLPRGIIEGGKVKEKEKLVIALKELKKQLPNHSKKKLYVVLTLPALDVYIQTFTLPQVAMSGLAQAADLNLQMISPIDISRAYYSWQKIASSSGDQVELLGGFVAKDTVDVYTESLEEAGFGIAAVEFSSLSLTRSIGRSGVVTAGKPYMAIEVTEDGIGFVITRNGVPHFHYFRPQEGTRAISIKSFSVVMEEEVNRILNFYATHWGGQAISDIVVVTTVLKDEITDLFKEKFPALTVQVPDTREVSVISGAALRGATSRSGDMELSLVGVGVLRVFEQEQTMNFIRVWRNAISTTLGFLLILFIASNLFVHNALTDSAERGLLLLNNPSIAELDQLKEQAIYFNESISAIEDIYSLRKEIYPLIVKINRLTWPDIEITRIGFNTVNNTMVVNGTAFNKKGAVDFKDRLAADGAFSGVDLPIANVSLDEGRASFSLEFGVEAIAF